ncbi:MAG: hypothetical protein P8Z80_21205, partial [Pseudolabrys sp.]
AVAGGLYEGGRWLFGLPMTAGAPKTPAHAPFKAVPADGLFHKSSYFAPDNARSPILIRASYITAAGGGGNWSDMGQGAAVGGTLGMVHFASLGRTHAHVMSGIRSATGGPVGAAIALTGKAGQYRTPYHLTNADLSSAVVNTIAGEAYTNNRASVDAVIDNMLNRVGTRGYGPSGSLLQVARAPGQYAGYRHASSKEAAFIRSRIRAIASGAVPDITHGSNEYRAGWYRGPWFRHHRGSPVIGGNRFGFNPRVGDGPYGPHPESEAVVVPHHPGVEHHTPLVLKLDGRTVARSTMKHITKDGNGPARSPRMPDPTAVRPISV